MIKSASFVKGAHIKLQPHTTSFVELSNPKVVLERTLRDFSCLTVGDTFTIMHNDKKKKNCIDVLEVKPSSAVSIIETDCEVDFATSLDYKEPKKLAIKPQQEDQDKPVKRELRPFTGPARRFDGQTVKPFVMDCRPKLNEQQFGVEDGSSNSNRSNLKSRKSGKLVFGFGVVQSHEASRKKLKEECKKETLKKKEAKFQPFTGRSFKLNG